MLTETQARELLAQAAATIDVPPGEPFGLAEHKRRRGPLPILAAVALVVAIVAGGTALWKQEHPSGVAGRSDTQAAEGIPSVFAYDTASAKKMLSDAGLAVTITPMPDCGPAGRAVRTRPTTGTPFEPGSPVNLFVTAPHPLASCLDPANETLAWQLLDFANGRGPAPRFAPEVSVYVDGGRTTLSGDEAADLDNWTPDSALGVLAAATRQEQQVNGHIATPELSIDAPSLATVSSCGDEGLPRELAGRQSIGISIVIPMDGVTLDCDAAYVYRTEGQIDAIVATTSLQPMPPVEELTGQDVGLALGLSPMFGDVSGCTVFAEYDGGGGFCLEGVTDDPVEEMTLALQIQGYERTAALEDYAAAKVQLPDVGNAELPSLVDKLREMERHLHKVSDPP